MTKPELQAKLNEANLAGKFEPGSFPVDEDLTDEVLKIINEEKLLSFAEARYIKIDKRDELVYKDLEEYKKYLSLN